MRVASAHKWVPHYDHWPDGIVVEPNHTFACAAVRSPCGRAGCGSARRARARLGVVCALARLTSSCSFARVDDVGRPDDCQHGGWRRGLLMTRYVSKKFPSVCEKKEGASRARPPETDFSMTCALVNTSRQIEVQSGAIRTERAGQAARQSMTALVNRCEPNQPRLALEGAASSSA